MTVIEVENVHKEYGGTVAVDDVSFSVEEAEIFGILGPNGAGKTTTVECVEGLRAPDRGRIRVLGLDPRTDGAELHQRVGVQLQETELPERLGVGEALELYSSPSTASCPAARSSGSPSPWPWSGSRGSPSSTSSPPGSTRRPGVRCGP
jgi:ABC-type multidrug transport system ATPase subunit